MSEQRNLAHLHMFGGTQSCRLVSTCECVPPQCLLQRGDLAPADQQEDRPSAVLVSSLKNS